MVRWGSIAIAAAVGAWAHGLAATFLFRSGERYFGAFAIACAIAWLILMIASLINRAEQTEREESRRWREHERATLELKAEIKRDEAARAADACRLQVARERAQKEGN